MGLASAGDLDGVVKERENRGEAFFGAPFASGKVEDDGGSAKAGDTAGEPGELVLLRASGTHGLGQTRDEAVEYADSGFGSAIARA